MKSVAYGLLTAGVLFSLRLCKDLGGMNWKPESGCCGGIRRARNQRRLRRILITKWMMFHLMNVLVMASLCDVPSSEVRIS